MAGDDQREPDGGEHRASSQGAPLVGDAPGGSETPTIAWPWLMRDAMRRRVHGSDRYRWWVLASVLTGMFAAGFSFTILAVSLPEIAGDLGGSETALTWAISGPLLTFAIAMPVLGKVGDVYGHRRVYLIGLGSFAVFTALSAFAWSVPALIIIRTIAGLEGAATGPASMALINKAFPAEDRVKAMGWFSLVGAGAPVFGLVIGGILIDAFGWRTLFIMQTPIALIALVINAVVVKETVRQERTRIDAAGAAAVATMAVSALVFLERGRAWGFGSPLVLACALLVPVGAMAFVAAERRARSPLIPLEFFGRRNFSACLLYTSPSPRD